MLTNTTMINKINQELLKKILIQNQLSIDLLKKTKESKKHFEKINKSIKE
jgi:hypothetical protein